MIVNSHSSMILLFAAAEYLQNWLWCNYLSTNFPHSCAIVNSNFMIKVEGGLTLYHIIYQIILGFTLGMCSDNERLCYNVTSFLIGWAYAQTDPQKSCHVPCIINHIMYITSHPISYHIMTLHHIYHHIITSCHSSLYCHKCWSTVECHYNTIQYCKIFRKYLKELRHNINQMLGPHKSPHISP